MSDNIGYPTDLNIANRLLDREYRRRFFLAESSEQIAKQLVSLRERRGLKQEQLAEQIGTQQPAISRIEKASYQNWSFNTLRKIAGALDARLRIEIKPSEDVLNEYNDDEASSALDIVTGSSHAVISLPAPQYVNLSRVASQTGIFNQLANWTSLPAYGGLAATTEFGAPSSLMPRSAFGAQERENVLERENMDLREQLRQSNEQVTNLQRVLLGLVPTPQSQSVERRPSQFIPSLPGQSQSIGAIQ